MSKEHCDRCGACVDSDTLGDVQVCRATHSSPSEWESWCEACRGSDEKDEHDRHEAYFSGRMDHGARDVR